jgi:uncharacterized protein (TIGR02996 family)
MTHPLIAEILLNPEDDAPRSVYADWLLDRGDPRGELIQIQCALAKLPVAAPQRAELAAQEAALLAAHGSSWLAELDISPMATAATANSAMRARGNAVVFRRGFIDEARLDFTTYAAASEQLALTPLRRLAVTRLEHNQVEDLAALPVAPTLIGLVLRDLHLTEAAVTALAAAPLLGGLVELGLQRVAFDGDSVRILAASRRLGGLRSMSLLESRARAFAALADASWLPQLETLDLSRSSALRDELWTLFRAPGWRALRVLGLASCSVNDATVGAIAASKPLSASLTHLDLTWSSLRDDGVQALVRSQRLAKLQVLTMKHCWLSKDHVVALRKRFGPRLVMD